MPVQLSVKATGADVVRQGLQDLAAEIPKIGRQGIYDKLLPVRTALRKPGARPSYPIKWDSERQRRFVMAMLRAMDQIPYRRQGSSSRWELVKLDKGYRFEHPGAHAVYLWGDYDGSRQSRIHEGRWPAMQPLVEAAIQQMPPEIENKITYYGRSKGF